MKELQCILDIAGLCYEDLCIYQNLKLLEGFKIPKFDTFRGVGNHISHLRDFCEKIVGVGRDEALLIQPVRRSSRIVHDA